MCGAEREYMLWIECGLHGFSYRGGDVGVMRVRAKRKAVFVGRSCAVLEAGWVRRNIDRRDGRGWPASTIVEIREN